MTSKALLWIIMVIVVAALIILPLTPEDVFITGPLIKFMGWKNFFILAGIMLVLLIIALIIAYNNDEIKDFLKRKNIISL